MVFLQIPTAHSQWLNESVQLHPGWNAVFLETSPYPAQCSVHFDTLPGVDSVWSYNDFFTALGNISGSTPTLPIKEDPKWLCYAPAHTGHAEASNLFILEAGRSYLIKCTQNATWSFKGQPRFRNRPWVANSLNLRGFYVDPAIPPTFSSYFAPSTSHQGAKIYRLVNNATWTEISNSAQINPGEAYWMECKTASDYEGPMRIKLTEGNVLDFSQNLVEHIIQIQHLGPGNHTVSFGSLPSTSVPTNPPGQPPFAGPVPLQYFDYGPPGIITGDREFKYVNLPASLTILNGDTAVNHVKFAVVRTNLAPFNGTGQYQSLLEIRDGAGSRRVVGVVCEGKGSGTAKINSGKLNKDLLGDDPMAGLWVGSVVMDMVSEPRSDPEDVTSTPAEFSFRVILHVDNEGNVRLLKRVIQMFREGLRIQDPVTGNDVPDPNYPGRYVLVTPGRTDLLSQLKAPTLRDERPFYRRISTAAFALRDPNGSPVDFVTMTKSGEPFEFGSAGSSLSTQLILPANDRHNPFRHQYHPSHQQGFRIVREIEMSFTADPPDGREEAGWGDNQVGGQYYEIFPYIPSISPTDPGTGLKNSEIHVAGWFRLQRASPVSVLNDGL